jgi:4-hydroxybenzoate polyprenyltransferase
MRFDRPIGALLLLWPTLWALWLAGAGAPSPRLVVIFMLGVVVMRAAGCVMNDIADRDFDPHVERTRSRPLAAGEVTLRAACILLLVLLLMALGLVLLTNRQTVLLAFIGAALALSYPFFKRFTHLPQAVLGMAFGWSIPMAFAAQAGAVPPAAWALFGINMLYALIYDTEYAMVDREDDLKIGIKSTAILFGRHDLLVLRVLMLAMLAAATVFGAWQQLAWPWYLGVAAAAALFGWQQVLLRQRDRVGCFRAFLNNNWVGLALFIGLWAQYQAG